MVWLSHFSKSGRDGVYGWSWSPMSPKPGDMGHPRSIDGLVIPCLQKRETCGLWMVLVSHVSKTRRHGAPAVHRWSGYPISPKEGEMGFMDGRGLPCLQTQETWGTHPQSIDGLVIPFLQKWERWGLWMVLVSHVSKPRRHGAPAVHRWSGYPVSPKEGDMRFMDGLGLPCLQNQETWGTRGP